MDVADFAGVDPVALVLRLTLTRPVDRGLGITGLITVVTTHDGEGRPVGRAVSQGEAEGIVADVWRVAVPLHDLVTELLYLRARHECRRELFGVRGPQWAANAAVAFPVGFNGAANDHSHVAVPVVVENDCSATAVSTAGAVLVVVTVDVVSRGTRTELSDSSTSLVSCDDVRCVIRRHAFTRSVQFGASGRRWRERDDILVVLVRRAVAESLHGLVGTDVVLRRDGNSPAAEDVTRLHPGVVHDARDAKGLAVAGDQYHPDALAAWSLVRLNFVSVLDEDGASRIAEGIAANLRVAELERARVCGTLARRVAERVVLPEVEALAVVRDVTVREVLAVVASAEVVLVADGSSHDGHATLRLPVRVERVDNAVGVRHVVVLVVNQDAHDPSVRADEDLIHVAVVPRRRGDGDAEFVEASSLLEAFDPRFGCARPLPELESAGEGGWRRRVGYSTRLCRHSIVACVEVWACGINSTQKTNAPK